jgi:hypothetical protein
MGNVGTNAFYGKVAIALSLGCYDLFMERAIVLMLQAVTAIG